MKLIKNISIKQRIRWSFSLLVLLFIINGIITILTLNNFKKVSEHLSTVVDPSLQVLNDFKKVIVESKMYTTNWVFLRSDEEDKKLLISLRDSGYYSLKSKISSYTDQWTNKSCADSLNVIYTGFEELLAIERKIMNSLQTFGDYDDPVIKLEAERNVEEEIIPRTSALISSLNNINSSVENIQAKENSRLEKLSQKLRIFIMALAIIIICGGYFLSRYLTGVIISHKNRIRDIINDLGKGIIQKVDTAANNDEIGRMVNSVNTLSEKLHATAAFAAEIGKRNFTSYFKPLSNKDVLGKALITMRDDIRSSDEKLNEAQHIARLGSWERNIETDKVILTDEMFNIFDIDPLLFDFQFQSILRLVHPDDMEYVMDTMRKNRYRVAIPFECRILTSKGVLKNIMVETKVVPGKHGEIEKTFGIVQDITERKKSEASLEIKNKELERKNKELEQFVYIASHDLQEPLRTTSSFVDLLQQQYHGKLDAKADKYLTYISQSSDRMKVLINDLLDYSRIGTKKQLQEVDCNIVLEEIIADLGQTIKDKQAEIRAGQLPVIAGYRTEIKQLFQNLIVNAIKFSKKDEAPRVNITASEDKTDWIFAIRDHGIGIAQEHRERIFIIFQRLHNRNEYEGSGIGLAHCKKIAGLHHGKIWVESPAGGGSTFYFSIPKSSSNENNKITGIINKAALTTGMNHAY